jgi:hypothetical protein
MATRYTQNVAIMQVPGFSPTSPIGDYVGGGPLVGPLGLGFPVQYNDSGLEIGAVKTVTAIYQLYGNESVNDIINIYLAQPGDLLDPSFSTVSGGSTAATGLTISVGDDDVTGYGLVSSGVAFAVTPLTGTTFPGAVTPQGASTTRYMSATSITGAVTTTFTGGTAFTDPYVIGALAVEPVGGSPGTGVSGSWIQATITAISGQIAGKVLVFRLRIIKP